MTVPPCPPWWRPFCMMEPLRLAALPALQAPIVCSLLASLPLARRLSTAPPLVHLAARPFVYSPLLIGLFVVERHPSATRQFSPRIYPSFPFASHAVDFTLPFIHCSFALRYPRASRIALSCSAPGISARACLFPILHSSVLIPSSSGAIRSPSHGVEAAPEQRFSLTRSYFATPGFATKTRFIAASRYRVVPACCPHVL
ncbi:hypothetical protein C8J57DRAFT_1540507 [Mycena rebaudengoi]|nr:hypothetical protein C8J57DRAFT_1540507 [Mycena rebaudengoi]